MNVFGPCLNSGWAKLSSVLFGPPQLPLSDSYMERKTLIRINQAKEKARPGKFLSSHVLKTEGQNVAHLALQGCGKGSWYCPPVLS